MIIVATSAGLGAIFSYMVPLIRAYNRISVFVALLALLAVAGLIDRVWAPESRKGLRLAVVLGLVVVALLDQTTPAFVPAYAATARKWKADAEFVSQVEGALPADSSVFQLPYVPFPESPFVNKMIDYDHLRPYLHSKTIHWSYGAVKGREVDLWQREVSSRKVPEMITELRAAGFNGLWIDRFGYADGAKAIEKQLSASLKAKGKQSRSGRYIFFKL
jgi:phosphoglycerol transferase